MISAFNKVVGLVASKDKRLIHLVGPKRIGKSSMLKGLWYYFRQSMEC